MLPYAAVNHACLDKQVIGCQQLTLHTEKSIGRERKEKKKTLKKKSNKQNLWKRLVQRFKLHLTNDLHLRMI